MRVKSPSLWQEFDVIIMSHILHITKHYLQLLVHQTALAGRTVELTKRVPATDKL